MQPFVRTRAHAKLNLSLRVLAREASGYHQIETLFCALELADDVEVSIAHSGITLEVGADEAACTMWNVQPPDTGPPDRNLALRAAFLFADAVPDEVSVRVRLIKRIPSGAGLGGGSSDAAAVLRALNTLYGDPLAPHELMRLGIRLGSDVPFFLADTALALAWGRGERLTPWPPLPRAPVVLAVPRTGVVTADAYGALPGVREPVPHVLRTPQSWDDVARSAHNDFEVVIFERVPVARTLRQVLADAGAICARMTGSGSVVFGVFDDEETASTAAQHIVAAHPETGVILTHTRE